MVSGINEELFAEVRRDYHANSDEFECDLIYFNGRAIYLDYKDIIDPTTKTADSISNQLGLIAKINLFLMCGFTAYLGFQVVRVCLNEDELAQQ